jgi:hypothetical protein
MNYNTLSLDQLGHALAAHKERRPGNHSGPALRLWATTKELIEFWICIRTQDEAWRWKTVYLPEKAIDVPQPPPEDAGQGLRDRMEELKAASSLGFTLDGPSNKKHAQRCATMRHGIREYCIRHGLEIPAAVRVVSPRDRHAAELSEVAL